MKKNRVSARVMYKIFESSWSHAGYVEGKNERELRNKAKELVRQTSGYNSFKGITISLNIIESDDRIVFNPR